MSDDESIMLLIVAALCVFVIGLLVGSHFEGYAERKRLIREVAEMEEVTKEKMILLIIDER